MLGTVAKVNAVKDIEEAYSMSVDVDDGFRYNGLVSNAHFGELKYSTDGKEFITVKELMQLKSNLSIRERKMMRGKYGKRKVWFDPFDFGYCLTVHKAQGSEWGNVLLFEETSGYWDDDYKRKWLYTAVTRSNDRLLIVK
jgi:superfamily I DNA/RNA helicase